MSDSSFASGIDSWRFRLFRPGFHVLYHYELRKAGWREAMAASVSIFDGERVLEVQMRQSGIAPILSAALPKARFSVVDLDEPNERGLRSDCISQRTLKSETGLI